MKPSARLLLTLSFLAATSHQAPAQQPGYPVQRLDERIETVQNHGEVHPRYFPRIAGNPDAQAEKLNPAPTFQLEFPGGPAHVLLDHLDIAMGQEKPNIMISPGMEEYEIPPFKLRQVTVADIFQALNSLSNNQARWELSGSQNPIWILKPANSNPFAPATGMNPLSFDQARRQGMDKANQVRLQIAQMEAERAQALAEVNRAQALAQAARTTLDPITGQFVTAEPPKSTRVFPIDNYLENYRIEDITTAIQTAWEMMPEKSPGELKYHKDTRLLIAVGTPEQLNLINEIISSLQRQAHGKPGAFMPPAQSMHELTPPPAKPEPTAAPRNPPKQPTAPEKPKSSPDSTLNTQPGIGSIPS